MSKPAIFIVDDEPNILELLRFNLGRNGYEVRTFEAAAPLLAVVETTVPDLFILDLMLPKIDGLELCRRLRNNAVTKDVPIIMLTAKTTELDKIVGLELGADDYITKPFSVLELVARVKALLRRQQRNVLSVDKILSSGDLSLDVPRREVWRAGQLIELSYKEFELLFILMSNDRRVLTRDFLLEKIWGIDFDGETRTVDVHIRFLRQKLENYSSNRYIETVRGVGYRFSFSQGENNE
ncbi:MAG: response regulator transcription factor [Negativicutes bacterium]